MAKKTSPSIPIEVWNGTGDRDFGIVAADRLAELGEAAASGL